MIKQGGCGDLELTWVKQTTYDWKRGTDVRFDLMAYRRVAIRANVQV